MPITVVPTDKDVPLITESVTPAMEIAEHAKAVFKTADFLRDAGLDEDVTDEQRSESREIFVGADTAPSVPSSSGVALHLRSLINRYDEQIVESAIQARAYILNRLLEISDPNGEAKIGEQLRALELMGKVSEIGMFTERVEVNINNKSTEELESELVSALTKYMGNAVVVDSPMDTVLGVDLDAELGRVQPQAKPTEQQAPDSP